LLSGGNAATYAGGYASDITRVIPVRGRFHGSAPTRDDLVLPAQAQAIAAILA